MAIPKPEDEVAQSPIPITATEIPQTAEAPEVQPVFISFQRYNSNECELNGMADSSFLWLIEFSILLLWGSVCFCRPVFRIR